jgi:hypothetical protein
MGVTFDPKPGHQRDGFPRLFAKGMFFCCGNGNDTGRL